MAKMGAKAKLAKFFKIDKKPKVKIMAKRPNWQIWPKGKTDQKVHTG